MSYSNTWTSTVLYERSLSVLLATFLALFFLAGCDWYVAEYDSEDLFWGFTILNEDYLNAEWGYGSFTELKSLDLLGLEVDREINWRVRPAREVDKIIKCHPHWQ